LLQLSFYSEQLGRVQGPLPERMHVVLGTSDRESFRVADFIAYYRRVRARFIEFVEHPARDVPAPGLALPGLRVEGIFGVRSCVDASVAMRDLTLEVPGARGDALLLVDGGRAGDEATRALPTFERLRSIVERERARRVLERVTV
jgi:hypothetical protein